MSEETDETDEPGSWVLDASAVLALLYAEPGADEVAEAIAGHAAVSTVNLGEVAKILIDRGQKPREILMPLTEQVTVEPFTLEDALQAAELYPRTASRGLSFGDRACLALAIRRQATAVTADQVWMSMDVAVDVQLIRQRGLG